MYDTTPSRAPDGDALPSFTRNEASYSFPAEGLRPKPITPSIGGVPIAELQTHITNIAQRVGRRHRHRAIDDLTQQGLLTALDMSLRYKKERGTFFAYIQVRVTGAMIDACRRARRLDRAPESDAEEFRDPIEQVEDATHEEKLQRDAVAAVAALPPLDRELVRACAMGTETVADAARRLEITYPAAWQRYRRAVARVRLSCEVREQDSGPATSAAA